MFTICNNKKACYNNVKNTWTENRSFIYVTITNHKLHGATLRGKLRRMAINAKTTNPIWPEGIKSPQDEKDRPSTGIWAITSIQLKINSYIQMNSLGGLKVLPGLQWTAGPGSIVTASQQARTK